MFLSPAALYAITFREGGRGDMVQRVSTVAFEGIEARAVDVQVQVAPGLPAFTMVSRQVQSLTQKRTGQPMRRLGACRQIEPPLSGDHPRLLDRSDFKMRA